MCQNAYRKIIFPLLSNDIVVLWRYVLLDDRVVDLRVPSNQARAFLRRGRQPEEKISRARTVVSPRFFIRIISNGEKILSNVNVFVWRQVKRENSTLPVAVRVSKTCVLKLPYMHDANFEMKVGKTKGEKSSGEPWNTVSGHWFS